MVSQSTSSEIVKMKYSEEITTVQTHKHIFNARGKKLKAIIEILSLEAKLLIESQDEPAMWAIGKIDKTDMNEYGGQTYIINIIRQTRDEKSPVFLPDAPDS